MRPQDLIANGYTKVKNSNPLHRAFWANAWILGFVIAFSLLAALLQLTVPLFMLLIYDRVVPARSYETLVALAVIALCMIAMMGVMDYARRRLLARFGARLQNDLEDDTARLNPDGIPRLTTKEVGLLDGIRSFYHSSTATAIIDILWVPLFVGAAFVLHPRFGITAIAGIVVLLLIFALSRLLSRHREREADVARDRVGAVVTLLKRSADVVSTQRLSHALHGNWKEARSTSRKSAIVARDRTAGFEMLMNTCRTMFSIIILFVGATLVLQSKISTGALVAGVVLLNRTFQPVTRLIKEFTAIGRARGRWRDLEAAFDRRSTTPSKTVEISATDFGLSLASATITSDFNAERIFELADLDVPPNALVEITGPSGSGKTLLAISLMRLRKLQGGTVRVGDLDIRQAPAARLADLFGYLPQQPRFVPGTIAQNIASFAPEPDAAAILKAGRDAHAHDLIQALPKGYQTEIDALASNLSNGHRQLIALARAVHGQPRILVLDEPGDILNHAFGTGLEAAIASYLQNGRSILLLGRQSYNILSTARRYEILDKKLEPLAVKTKQKKKLASGGPTLVRPA